ncbi:MAG: PEP-CTERM system histidine kinase PrsK, partial [Pseudomonadota bacterium]|nr:PEP-CTERM system histidine kinase PrsK [Pseudomonadota bacterium]
MIAFWANSLAALTFAVLLLWRLGSSARHPGHWLLLGSFALTACWAWIAAIAPGSPLASYAETARNLVWVGLLHNIFDSGTGDTRQPAVRLVYAAVAAALGVQLIFDSILLTTSSQAVSDTGHILRMTAAAGALVLVHNLYGQASPGSRSSIRYVVIALALSWIYDLNLYTVAYLEPLKASGLADWRGAAIALIGGFFALGAKHEDGWRVRLSRAATFQSLSLLAICAYFAVMAMVATALRGTTLDWPRTVAVAVLAMMTVAAMVLLPSARARAWAKVKIAKHVFEHRYDYRTEWLRFTDTLGSSSADGRPLAQRVIKAFADIVECPGGLLLECDAGGAVAITASCDWPGRSPDPNDTDTGRAFWQELAASGRVIELDAVRQGIAEPQDRALTIPGWILGDAAIWVCVPLLHQRRMTGLVVLATPEYRRPLDWEDFDLLRTAGRQAASSLAEAQGQRALSDAQRFEEFNRRFAFILHDIKNLVSQLSLLTRNAERHAENAEFRADMIATLKSSIAKMNDLLARLAPQATARASPTDPQPLRDILSAAIAAHRGPQPVQLLGEWGHWVNADATALEQAVGHLLQNAIEASPSGQPVAVRANVDGSELCIAISDKGAGMDPDFVRNSLFRPFVS